MSYENKIDTGFHYRQYAPFGKYGELIVAASNFVCGLDASLAVIGGKWKPLILFHLAHEARRYGDLRRAVGNVSDKMLIQQLKELEADGIVDRHDFKEIPPKVEYSLTPFGETLAEALRPLCAWGTQHMTEVAKLMSQRA
ncbi:winged helix-turn-helix transcriptional regulator [Agrobacterium larrymoorei]|uniref:winged helix-turn-helix transcriptional regulator n=1 Tax=Agrobacterium larrymoorei TaxID=160699 RepID=UPI003CC91742